jgi:hypothetical protein
MAARFRQEINDLNGLLRMPTRNPTAARVNTSPSAKETDLVEDRFILVPMLITSRWTFNFKVRA